MPIGRYMLGETQSNKLLVKKEEKTKHQVITLFDKTEQLAKLENKIPVVALCQKHRKGFWIVVKETDLQKVIDVQRKNT